MHFAWANVRDKGGQFWQSGRGNQTAQGVSKRDCRMMGWLPRPVLRGRKAMVNKQQFKSGRGRLKSKLWLVDAYQYGYICSALIDHNKFTLRTSTEARLAPGYIVQVFIDSCTLQLGQAKCVTLVTTKCCTGVHRLDNSTTVQPYNWSKQSVFATRLDINTRSGYTLVKKLKSLRISDLFHVKSNFRNISQNNFFDPRPFW